MVMLFATGELTYQLDGERWKFPKVLPELKVSDSI